MTAFNDKYGERDPYDVAVDGIREFFKLLDQVEVSDGGMEFRPTTIRCCRSLDVPKLEAALQKMRVVI